MAQTMRNLPATWETQVWSLGREDPLEKGMAAHSGLFADRIPWIEDPGGLQFMGSQRVRHHWATHTHTHTHTHRQMLIPPQGHFQLGPTPWLPSRNVRIVWPDWVFPGKKKREREKKLETTKIRNLDFLSQILTFSLFKWNLSNRQKLVANCRQNFKPTDDQTKLDCGLSPKLLAQDSLPPAMWQITKQGGKWEGSEAASWLNSKTIGLSPNLRVRGQDVAFAEVWWGHPDVRVPAGSSAPPCLLKEGLEQVS